MLGFIKRWVDYISYWVLKQQKTGYAACEYVTTFRSCKSTFLHYLLLSLIHCRVWQMMHMLLVRTAIKAEVLFPDSANPFLAKSWLHGSEGRSAEDIKGWRSQLIGKNL